MIKEKKILFSFLSWFLCFLFLIFVGVSNIFALETKTIYGGITNGTLNQPNKYNYGIINQGGTQSIVLGNVNTAISGVSYYFGFYYYETIELNKTYTLVINFYDYDLLNTFQSGWVKIQTCYSETCNDTTLVSVVKNNNSGNSNKLTINFNPMTVGSYVLVRLVGNNNNVLTGIDSFGIKSIQTESTNSSQDIIDNQTNNTNNIINNQNSNNQQVLDTIDENLNSCTESKNLFNKNNLNGGWIRYSDGAVFEQYTDTYNYTNYIKVQPNTTYTLDLYNSSNLQNAGIIEYTSNYSFIKGTSENQRIMTFTTTASTEYIRFTIRLSAKDNIMLNLGSNPLPYEEYGERICKNKIDETNDKLDTTNSQLNDLNSNLTDETGPNTSSLNNVAGWLPPGPVDSILTLPLTFLNNLNNAIGGTCSPVNVNLPFVNKTLSLPCFNSLMSQYLPNFNTLYTWIGGIVSVYILFNYLLTLYKWVDDTLSLRENTMPGYFDDRFGGGA